MITKMKKVAALLMVLVITASMVVVFGSAEVNAAGKSYKMPTGLKTYEYVNGKWKKTNDRTYKYDSKGNMNNWDGSVLKLSYNKNKLKKVTVTSNSDKSRPCNTTKVYDSKGRIKKITYDYTNFYKSSAVYKYNKKGYISRRDLDSIIGPIVETYTFKYHKNGLPKQITMVSIADGDKEKTVETYNSKGLYTSCKVYLHGKIQKSHTVSYKMSGNQVKSAVENYKIREGKKSNYKWKYVYTYGKAKTKSSKQYAAIISMTHGSLLFRTVGDNSAVGWCR